MSKRRDERIARMLPEHKVELLRKHMFPGCCGAYVLHNFGAHDHTIKPEELEALLGKVADGPRQGGEFIGEQAKRAVHMVALVEQSQAEAIVICLEQGFEPVLRWKGQHGDYSVVLMVRGDFEYCDLDNYGIPVGEELKRFIAGEDEGEEDGLRAEGL